MDEVKLSYQCLVGLLQQRIINVLHKAYNMQYNEAYIFLDSNRRYENPLITQIIESIIKSSPRGLPVIINRNPTIMYGGILQMYCVGISAAYSMLVPQAILRGLAADFDGDTLNILLIINNDFLRAAERVFNPANAMVISKNDGYFNNDYNLQRDELINLSTLINLSRGNYSKEQLEQIERMKAMKPSNV